MAVPLVLLLLTGSAQSEVGVVERSGLLTVRQATPYLADPGSVVEVTPYLPGMAVFGLPRAVLGGDGLPARLLGDARIWCAAAFLGCLWAARRAAVPGAYGRRTAGRGTMSTCALGAFVASPVVALPLCVSGIDLPLTGLLVLALVYAARRRPLATGVSLAAVCSLKWTAWPAVAVTVALLARRGGWRTAARGAAVAVGGTAVLVLPAVLLSPGPLVEQVFMFPAGRGPWETPAASPLPGRLLAGLGPAGWCAAVTLLLSAGLAVAVSLLIRPPHDLVRAADRLALGLCAAFLLAPAGRFGRRCGGGGIRRMVATTHGHEIWWARTPGARQVLRRIGDHVDAVTCLGEYTRRRIAPALGPRAELVRLVPGVDPAAFLPEPGAARRIRGVKPAGPR
ncbi:hypothetical protein GCM10009535_10120 [Streptomyces thermocarboxydovorans]|uniref:Integral membrane protein n=1 Tax=Streptomyces thermocarboxydovorans TaxID=59298 RepID=A0ABN1HAV5_9ACTN